MFGDVVRRLIEFGSVIVDFGKFIDMIEVCVMVVDGLVMLFCEELYVVFDLEKL